MIDALGCPQSLVVFGGTSEIARACVTRLARTGRLQRVVLCGRADAALHGVADEVRALGVATVEVRHFEAAETGRHRALVEAVTDGTDIDVVLVAAGVLPDQARALEDPDTASAAALANYVGPASVLLWSARALRAQGHGVLVVLSSVAAERPRRSNFVYGATKAGLDALATGLGDELAGTGVSVLVVRPGFVRTRMTAGTAPAPLASTAEDVADAIAAHLTRGSATVWVPATLRPVMSLLRHLPRAVFRRLPL